MKQGTLPGFKEFTSTETIGRKDDDGKLQYSLIPPSTTLALAKVLTFGANKYEANSWKHVPNAKQRYLDAAMRHLESYRSGEILDKESDLSHLSHLLTNIAFLIDLEA